jgi:hypothetical protein
VTEVDFKDLPTENPLADQSYADAVAALTLMQLTSSAVAMVDIIFSYSVMVEPTLAP